MTLLEHFDIKTIVEMVLSCGLIFIKRKNMEALNVGQKL